MGYIIGQYNHAYDKMQGDNFSENFLSPIPSTSIKIGKLTTDTDMGIVESVSNQANEMAFFNDCIMLSGNKFFQGKNYFLRCQVQRDVRPVEFYLKLTNKGTPDGSSIQDEVDQYIKTIVIQGGLPNEWVTIEVIFQPLIDFGNLLFEVKRTIRDYQDYATKLRIGVQQLCEINNIISTRLGLGDKSLLKMGIQSHPGLKLCVNGEEINLSRSGIYEVKNGIIPIEFLSVVSNSPKTSNVIDNTGTDETTDNDYTFVVSDNENIGGDDVVPEEPAIATNTLTLQLLKSLIYLQDEVEIDLNLTDNALTRKIKHILANVNNLYSATKEQRYNRIISLLESLLRDSQTFNSIQDWKNYIYLKINSVLSVENLTADIVLKIIEHEIQETRRYSYVNGQYTPIPDGSFDTTTLEGWKEFISYIVKELENLEVHMIVPSHMSKPEVLQEIGKLYDSLLSRNFTSEFSSFDIDQFTVDFMYKDVEMETTNNEEINTDNTINDSSSDTEGN